MEADTVTAICGVIIALLSLAYTIHANSKQTQANEKSLEIANSSLDVATKVAKSEQFFRDIDSRPNIIFTMARHDEDSDRDFVGIQIENRGPGYAKVFPPIINLENKNKMVICEFMAKPPIDNIEIWNVHNLMILPPNEKKKVIWIQKEAFENASEREKSILLNSSVTCMYTDLVDNEYFGFGGNASGMALNQQMQEFLGEQFSKNRKILEIVSTSQEQMRRLGR